jgi:hypothetical protein
MKFTKTKTEIRRFSLEVRDMAEPSSSVGDEWYHRTRPAEVADIVTLLRADPAVRDAVLEGLDGNYPQRSPDQNSRAACESPCVRTDV